ncbi:hypothetical protein [Poseidonocella sedimentorum]|uniref:Uncharacterized protein n=1 Tax=Poseidonocella sedimentorum TaxID=871652 RepID=A0A1I6E1N3_9RHOB|nr:hypothetical protein [Poseidonocella sedimentorum]SFR11461.1 hypothetical protein SAMN04515673_106207 [Poseidonocella sedimentorum]
MTLRSTRSTVTFSNPFTLSGYPDELPAGEYEVLVEEELLQGLSFEAYRRTATQLTVRGRGSHAGHTELRAISENDLTKALSRDQAKTETNYHSDAALSPPKEQK